MRSTVNSTTNQADKPTLLFSVNTYLAYAIAQKYYSATHYAWFTTQFDFGNQQPASSNPRSICRDILEAIATDDHHCEKLVRIKNGILQGAYEKRKNGIISGEQELEIRALVTRSDHYLDLLMPVVFVTSWEKLESYCERMGIADIASPCSIEYLSRELPRTAFDIIDLKKLLSSIDCFNRGDI